MLSWTSDTNNMSCFYQSCLSPGRNAKVHSCNIAWLNRDVLSIHRPPLFDTLLQACLYQALIFSFLFLLHHHSALGILRLQTAIHKHPDMCCPPLLPYSVCLSFG